MVTPTYRTVVYQLTATPCYALKTRDYVMQELFTCNVSGWNRCSYIGEQARYTILTDNTSDRRHNLSQATTLASCPNYANG